MKTQPHLVKLITHRRESGIRRLKGLCASLGSQVSTPKDHTPLPPWPALFIVDLTGTDPLKAHIFQSCSYALDDILYQRDPSQNQAPLTFLSISSGGKTKQSEQTDLGNEKHFDRMLRDVFKKKQNKLPDIIKINHLTIPQQIHLPDLFQSACFRFLLYIQFELSEKKGFSLENFFRWGSLIHKIPSLSECQDQIFNQKSLDAFLLPETLKSNLLTHMCDYIQESQPEDVGFGSDGVHFAVSLNFQKNRCPERLALLKEKSPGVCIEHDHGSLTSPLSPSPMNSSLFDSLFLFPLPTLYLSSGEPVDSLSFKGATLTCHDYKKSEVDAGSFQSQNTKRSA